MEPEKDAASGLYGPLLITIKELWRSKTIVALFDQPTQELWYELYF